MFNIALLAKNNAHEFIKLSQKLIREMNAPADYALSETSHPHITLAQFDLPAQLSIVHLMKNITDLIEKWPEDTLLHLHNLHFKLQPPYLWLQLALTQPKQIYPLHVSVVSFLMERGIICRNKSLENYNPHLTLARIKAMKLIPPDESMVEINIADHFRLVLAKGDAIGQLIEVMTLSSHG